MTDANATLNGAIDSFSTVGNQQFSKAYQKLVPNEPTEAVRKAAQADLASALSQISSAARLQAEQTDRAGFAAVVKLMQTTADTTDSICKKLLNLAGAEPPNNTAPTTGQFQLIAALTQALQVLAQLSPVAVWIKDGRSTGT
jgi:hypothetical protein